jgi:dihydrofolate synthase/folylpolyglutamate synthase
MRAILESAGLAVHVYTSPHLVRFHERIRLGRSAAAASSTRSAWSRRCAAATRQSRRADHGVRDHHGGGPAPVSPRRPATCCCWRSGLGGRLDATNVIDAPAAAVVTPIGRDHDEYLGDTLAKVAFEKAGIFKRGCPAVIAPQDYPEADAVLCEQAERVGASPIHIGAQDFSVAEERGRLVFQDGDGLLDLPRPKLAGRHQIVNAGTAIAALRAAGFGDLDPFVYEAGLGRANWPGRLQQINRGRLPALAPAGCELWLDGGHNQDGGRVLAAAMADLEERSAAPLVLVAGMLGTKDAAGFLRNFSGLARELIAVPIAGQLAARPADEIAAIARQVGLTASSAPGIEAAVASLHDFVWDRAPRVLICGSLYLAGEVLSANGTPPT